jgi:hypothetical protein
VSLFLFIDGKNPSPARVSALEPPRAGKAQQRR